MIIENILPHFFLKKGKDEEELRDKIKCRLNYLVKQLIEYCEIFNQWKDIVPIDRYNVLAGIFGLYVDTYIKEVILYKDQKMIWTIIPNNGNVGINHSSKHFNYIRDSRFYNSKINMPEAGIEALQTNLRFITLECIRLDSLIKYFTNSEPNIAKELPVNEIDIFDDDIMASALKLTKDNVEVIRILQNNYINYKNFIK